MCSVFRWTMYNTAYTPKAVKREINPSHFCGNMHIRNKTYKSHLKTQRLWKTSPCFVSIRICYLYSSTVISLQLIYFLTQLWESYPDYRHFLPPVFTAMPGMAALFTQARSSKLQIPHPHGICIMGYKSQGFLGEWFFPIQTEIKIIVHKLCNAVR